MEPLSDSELERLLGDLESDCVERKETWSGSASEAASQAVCAFANDLPGHERPGVLFIGVRDNGQPANLPITDELLLKLADLRSSGNIVPPPTLTVQKRVLLGADVAVITVWPADAPPVRYKGQIWTRVGPRRAMASAQDERILNEKRRFRDRHFEAHPIASCTLEDIDRYAFERGYLPRAVDPDVLAANERSYEERLASCGMIASADQPIPTVLGLLVAGVSARSWIAGAYVQFLRIRGRSITDPIADQAEIDGTISDTIRRLDEKLSAHLTTSADFTSQDREVRFSPYPLTAVQQFARNAILHRTYEGTNAPARVYWYDDRIEINNPGGPYGSVTRENFGQPGLTDYRNPQLAAAFKVLGYAQRFGAGIAAARQALKTNGNPPPEFQVDQNFVSVTVRRAPGIY
jgi:ATP-dependent DNA helicase RecG